MPIQKGDVPRTVDLGWATISASFPPFATFANIPLLAPTLTTVSISGPDNFGQYGPATPKTSTNGIQEAINFVQTAGGGIVQLAPQVFSNNQVTITNSNVTLRGYNVVKGENTFSSGLNVVNSLLFDSSNGAISNTVIEGIQFSGSIVFNCANNMTDTFFHWCNISSSSVANSVQVKSGTGFCNFLFFEDCDMTAAGNNNTNCVTWTNPTSGNGQVYFHNVSIGLASNSATSSFFSLGAAGAIGPQVTLFDCSIEPNSTNPNMSYLVNIQSNGTNNTALSLLTVADNYFELHGPLTLLNVPLGVSDLNANIHHNTFSVTVPNVSGSSLTVITNSNSSGQWDNSGNRQNTVSFNNNTIIINNASCSAILGNLGAMTNAFTVVSYGNASASSFVNVGTVASPFDTTNNNVVPVGGLAVTPKTATDYQVCVGDIWLGLSGGTNVSLTVKDAGGNTIGTPGATYNGVIKRGWKVNFGSFSGTAPTINVAYGGI